MSNRQIAEQWVVEHSVVKDCEHTAATCLALSLDEAEKCGRRAGIAECVKALRATAVIYADQAIAAKKQNKEAGRYYARSGGERTEAADYLERTLGTTVAKPVEQAALTDERIEAALHAGMLARQQAEERWRDAGTRLGVEQAPVTVCKGDWDTGRWINEHGECQCPVCREAGRPANKPVPTAPLSCAHGRTGGMCPHCGGFATREHTAAELEIDHLATRKPRKGTK